MSDPGVSSVSCRDVADLLGRRLVWLGGAGVLFGRLRLRCSSRGAGIRVPDRELGAIDLVTAGIEASHRNTIGFGISSEVDLTCALEGLREDPVKDLAILRGAGCRGHLWLLHDDGVLDRSTRGPRTIENPAFRRAEGAAVSATVNG